ncbi:MAG: tetratricopeptide repeat protein [bacterium]|nr:tetratricopeptide repeat protein [bacterium]
MNSAVRNVLLFGGVLLLVVLGSLFYNRMLRREPAPAAWPSGTAAPSNAPVVSPMSDAELPQEVRDGVAAYRAGDLRKARELLSSVPSSDPAYLVAQHNLGAVHTTMGNFEGALESLVRVTELQPENPEPYVALAWGYYRVLRYDEAKTTILHTLELNPDHVRARYSLALFRLADGDLSRSISSYDRAMKRDRAQQGFARAYQELQQFGAIRADLPDVHYVLAFFARSVGDPQKEVEALEQYLSLSPTGPTVELAQARLAEARAAAR